MSAVASAPGKVILFGEHFVVKDQPAIAVAVSLRSRVKATLTDYPKIKIYSRNLKLSGEYGIPPQDDKSPLYPIAYAAYLVMKRAGKTRGIEIEVDSQIPPAAGMGSSAAVSVATVAATAAALGESMTPEEISRTAYECERLVHGKPSGIDNTISTLGGSIAYRKSEGFLRLNVDFSEVALILADTGKPRNTGQLVKQVLDLYEAFPTILEPVYYAAGRLVVEAAKIMERGDWEAVGVLMNINHGLLSAIGVSSPEIEQLVHTARRAGALGSKLTGAGEGGFIIALSRKERSQQVVDKLKEISPRVLTTEITEKGVTIEEKK